MSNTIQSGLVDDELLELAHASLRSAEVSERVLALRQEWIEICANHKMPDGVMYDAHRDKRGRAVFSVRAPNGYHESHDGFEEALELLVNAHRPPIEV